jgi:hypothetical protein
MTIASTQCTARSSRSGKRCKRLVRGGGVCVMHGGAAPHVKAKRLERLALAEQLESAPRRHPGAILLDAVHTADILAQQARAEVAQQGVTVKTARALIDATIRAATLSRSALSAEAEDRSSRFTEGQLRSIEAALLRFLAEVGLSEDLSARRALTGALDGVAGEDRLLAAVTARRRTDEEIGHYVADVISNVLTSIGLDRDEWARAQVAATLRAVGRGAVPQSAAPPRSWWEAIARRAASELGLPDPTTTAKPTAPPYEILPPLPRRAIGGA